MGAVFIAVSENRNTIGIGNSRFAGRAGSEATAIALGRIVSNQRVVNLKSRLINVFITVAALDEHAATAPVISGIGRIVGDISV